MVRITRRYAAILSVIAAVAIVSSLGIANGNVDETQKVIPPANAQVTTDAMMEITKQINANLSSREAAPEVHRENINQVEHLVFGKPVILQTNTAPDTIAISADYDQMVMILKDSLNQCVNGACAANGEVAAQAKELSDRITYWQETKANLEVQTMQDNCDVLKPETCRQLDRGDEPTLKGQGLVVGNDLIWDGWYREIRSPFSPLSWYPTFSVPQENVIVPAGPLAEGECSTVVKEIQGVKAIQRPVIIPIWQEPWTSRASIIGWQTVWVVDFIPAEFVKNLNFCNVGGSIAFDYDINVIIERQLTHFWKFLPAGVP